MTPARAIALLGLPTGPCSERSVRAAYAQRVKEAHPDTGEGGAASSVPIRDLQMARDVLLGNAAPQNACKMCQGRGKVRFGMGWRSCSACNGSGETQ